MALRDYYNRVNPDLLRLIPPDADVVLEAGCGAAALAAAYRQVNPNVSYFGIEKNPEAAEAARAGGQINCVIVADLETVGLAEFGLSEAQPSVDCLIYGDVLEHLVDPWAVLSRLAVLFVKTGKFWRVFPTFSTTR